LTLFRAALASSRTTAPALAKTIGRIMLTRTDIARIVLVGARAQSLGGGTSHIANSFDSNGFHFAASVRTPQGFDGSF
jgi:hypothetical protein